MRYVLFLCCCFSLFGAHLDLEVSAKSAILMNADSGAILFEKHSHIPSFPASTTKVATALFVLESGVDLTQMATVSSEALKPRPLKDRDHLPSYWLDSDGTMMGLKRGEELSLESLLHGLVLISGNDAANVIAETVGITVPSFMAMLNEYLQSIGCKNTQFSNPHGLTHPEHFTTAFDMALIAKRAIKVPKFRQIVTTLKYTKPQTNKQPESEIRLTNALMRPKSKFYYPKAIGIKTGFTSASKHTLVAAAEHEGRTLVAVVLGCEKSEDRYIDAKKLFEAAFSQTREKRRLIGQENIFIREIADSTVSLQATVAEDLVIEYFPAEEPKCKAAVHWIARSVPIYKGEKVGEVHILDDSNDELIAKSDLIAAVDLKGSLFTRFKESLIRLFSSN